ncbi:MAG: hypothetical protein EBV03_04760 [Proteobacteria bacterium]|nr:hypothetical protein [Pseudomonadota bacterium]
MSHKGFMSAESVVIILALLAASPANAQTGAGGGPTGLTMGSPGNVNGSTQGPDTAPGAGPNKDAMITTGGITSDSVVTSDPGATAKTGVSHSYGAVHPGTAATTAPSAGKVSNEPEASRATLTTPPLTSQQELERRTQGAPSNR